ncbi:hypothetical protein RchiOBHm_Chr4g0401491 [Rosa chinensis]|uniref:Uncharacterized protein n=1 Tax=Rosa chinensis TaxID=74649 RepID=A0A2P6QT50_ROSCH|nr:hypothetical protein RchiOBHm_Chr4g0401491 [Rosa chinensis]
MKLPEFVQDAIDRKAAVLTCDLDPFLLWARLLHVLWVIIVLWAY